ncbi:MAG TPA: glycosyltransferase family 2 protein [Alphaproteobacteria bacterium]|nr:glycosyltransferase family 2 protein [Alphaproteobacteria bacterium]
MLDRITPLILTFNEAPNIEANLERLAWAPEVVVVDSYSTDDTVARARRFSNVRVVQRVFDTLANQWNFALTEAGIRTEWAMRLDADYRLTPALVDEMARLDPPADVAGYSIPCRYCIFGRPLSGSLYPRTVRLFRHARSRFRQTGHAEALDVEGRVLDLASPFDHDDRKPLERFFQSQTRYMREEEQRLAVSLPGTRRFADRVRRLRYVAPFAVLAYCLFGRGLIFQGRAGIYYSFQRAAAEMFLSLYLLDRDLRGSGDR